MNKPGQQRDRQHDIDGRAREGDEQALPARLRSQRRVGIGARPRRRAARRPSSRSRRTESAENRKSVSPRRNPNSRGPKPEAERLHLYVEERAPPNSAPVRGPGSSPRSGPGTTRCFQAEPYSLYLLRTRAAPLRLSLFRAFSGVESPCEPLRPRFPVDLQHFSHRTRFPHRNPLQSLRDQSPRSREMKSCPPETPPPRPHRPRSACRWPTRPVSCAS